MSDDHESDRLAGLHSGSGMPPDPNARYRDPQTGTYDPRRLAEGIARHPAPSAYDKRTGRWLRGERPRQHEPSPAKPPPEPSNQELVWAHEEKVAYYRYHAARNQGEDVSPPPPARYPHLWDQVGG